MALKSSFVLFGEAAGLEEPPVPPGSQLFVEPGAAAAAAPDATMFLGTTGLCPAPFVDRVLRSARGLIAALLQQPGNEKR